MSYLFLAITLLKQSPLPEKQFRIFLSHLSQQSLKDYLSEAKIYNGKRNMNKADLTDMIISKKDKSMIDVCLNDCCMFGRIFYSIFVRIFYSFFVRILNSMSVRIIYNMFVRIFYSMFVKIFYSML